MSGTISGRLYLIGVAANIMERRPIADRISGTLRRRKRQIYL